MDRETIRAIETKAAQIRKRFRINPDRFVRWGLVGGAPAGAVAFVVAGLMGGFRLDSNWLGHLLGGMMMGAIAGGFAGLIISLLYEASLAVVDFVGALGRSKTRSADNEDSRTE